MIILIIDRERFIYFNLILLYESIIENIRRKRFEMKFYKERFNEIYEYLKNKIDSSKYMNFYQKKFLEIQKDSENQFRIFINEEYYMRDIKIIFNSSNNIIDIYEYDSEENKYNKIFLINMILYDDYFDRMKKMILSMINDLLIFYDRIIIL